MALPLTLNPMFTQTNRMAPLSSALNQAFRTMLEAEDSSGSPAYNIMQQDDHRYCISLAVPGYTESELSVTAQQDALVVNGTHVAHDGKEESHYLHRGFSKRSFETSFRLGEHVKVQGAELKNGLLHIQLERLIPESAKPQSIPIISTDSPMTAKKRN